VSGKELEVGKSYEVEVYGLTDLAGNKGGTPERASIVVTKDAVKPNFVINPVGPKTFEIKFDKDMNTAVAVDSIKVKDAKGNAVALKALPSFKDDKRTLVVELAALPFADATVNSATLDVTVQALQDKLGNVVDTKTSQVTLVRDTVKPAIKEAKFTAANEIEVEFSEAVTGVEAGDFFVNKQDGTSATTVSGVTPVAGTNKYKLALAGSLKNGSYSLVLKVNGVSDDSSNTNDAQVLTITNDKEVVTPVAPLSAYIQSAGVTSAAKTVTVTFDKNDVLAGINPATGNLYVDGADNKALYSINGAALPAKAKVTFNNDQSVSEATVGADLNKDGDMTDTVVVDTVTIDLSEVDAKDLVGAFAAFGNGGTATISVGGVKNAAGATLPLTSLPVAVADATMPVVKEAYITGNATNGYKLTVKFSEAMKAVDEADFVLAGKADASTAATGITLGTAVLSADGLSAEIPVTDLGDADRTLGFTLATDVQANLDSTTDKADNPLTEITTPIAVTNFTTN
jgi:trimeric autotransporter adhesin